MRILHDTNSLVRIFVRRGEILGFKETLLTHHLTHITSPFILNEVEEVLSERMGLTRQKAQAQLGSGAS